MTAKARRRVAAIRRRLLRAYRRGMSLPQVRALMNAEIAYALEDRGLFDVTFEY